MVVGRTRTEISESYLTYRTEPQYCPMCGRLWGLEHKIEIAQALVDELKPPAKRILVKLVTPGPKDAKLEKIETE